MEARRWVLLGSLYAAPALAVVAALRWLELAPIPAWLAWGLGGPALLLPGDRLPPWVRDPTSVPEPH